MITRWIGQEDPNGCLVACAAMILGTDFAYMDATLRKAGVRNDAEGLAQNRLENWLAEQGFALQQVMIFGVENRRREPWPPLPWADLHLCNVHVTQNYHGVIMLADGTVLDPLGPEPRKLRDYRAVNSVAGVYRVGRFPCCPATGPTADEIRAAENPPAHLTDAD